MNPLLLLDHVSCAVIIKDKQSRFVYCNEKFAEIAQAESPTTLLGKSDDDLIWRKQAGYFQGKDKLAMQGIIQNNEFEEIMIENQPVGVLVTKKPWINKDKCDGVVCSFLVVKDYHIQKKHGFYDETQKRFYLGNEFKNDFLTLQEYKLLKLILRGFTAKKMALQLQLSVRTVESYIENIKNKLRCRTKNEIIDVAINAGWYHII